MLLAAAAALWCSSSEFEWDEDEGLSTSETPESAGLGGSEPEIDNKKTVNKPKCLRRKIIELCTLNSQFFKERKAVLITYVGRDELALFLSTLPVQKRGKATPADDEFDKKPNNVIVAKGHGKNMGCVILYIGGFIGIHQRPLWSSSLLLT